MKNILLLPILIIVLAACNNEKKTAENAAPSLDSISKTPTKNQWFATGNKTDYNSGIALGVGMNNTNAARVKSTGEIKKDDFGAMMQYITADMYDGKRIRMSAYLKTNDVKDGAGLWLRGDIDSVTYVFDNMEDGKKERKVKGTTDWTRYEIVMDVPANTFALAYGCLLSGKGEIWCDNFAFEIVGDSVPTTTVVIQKGQRIIDEHKALSALSSASAQFLPANTVASKDAPSNLNFDE
jgi:hypothetical protein